MADLRHATVTPRIVVSVVAGSKPVMIRRFLRSLGDTFERPTNSLAVVAVINGGGDDGVDLYELGATTVLHRQRPWGFAANHNQIIRDCPADYYVIANDDVIVLPGSLDRLISFMEQPESRRVGAVSPRLLNPDGSLQRSTYAFPTVPRVLLGWTPARAWLGTGRVAHRLAGFAGRTDGQSRMWAHDRQVDVDTLRGAFVVVRGACIAEVGEMLEIALVGGEETEWHRRMWDAGWRVVFLPEAEVVHEAHSTVGNRRDLEAEYARSALYYVRRHLGLARWMVARVAGVPIFSARWTTALVRGDRAARLGAAACLREMISARMQI